ncbi:MAG: hypothetical protein KAI47_08415, partial [Deltaproteobacteria bacterium]|nr:hypothetical protein [Deltaproteobacteria bacterium]
GVEIDPTTLTALGKRDAAGNVEGGISFAGATISVTGEEKPGPFSGTPPAPKVMFKRENPDEVCVARSSDIICPMIVIGTWRDLPDFVVGGSLADYDDGLPEVAPTRLEKDIVSPTLMNLKVYSSYSLILSFDERLSDTITSFSFSAKRAGNDEVLPLRIKRVGKVGDGDLLPSQIWLSTAKGLPMGIGTTYILTYSGVMDALGNAQKTPRSVNWTAPETLVPDEDTRPPAVLAVLPKSPTRLLVQFDEAVDSATAATTANYRIAAQGGAAAPSVTLATMQPGGTAVVLTTTDQAKQASYTLTVEKIADGAVPPNVLSSQTVSFKGFGDDQAPKVIFAEALSPTKIAVAFDESLSPLSVTAGSFSIAGLTISGTDFSGAASRKVGAFSPKTTTFSEDIVVLTTSTMSAGQAYIVSPSGVTDLSGNACKTTTSFKGVAKAKTVDVVLSYRLDNTAKVGGATPARAISPQELADQREGVFVLGGTATPSGGKTGDPPDDVSKQLGTFPPEGQPTAGLAKRLQDDGQDGDATAGDHIFSIRIRDLPLGSAILWKAFASYTVAFKNAHPSNLSAAFADATPGPSVFTDGQEFPGNENGVRILGDRDGDGVVRIRCLFGDEVTFKKVTDAPVFVWAVDDVSWKK